MKEPDKGAAAAERLRSDPAVIGTAIEEGVPEDVAEEVLEYVAQQVERDGAIGIDDRGRLLSVDYIRRT